jgi:hypothetical protein
MSEFLTPYEMSKMLEGVIPANRVARPNYLQTSFGNVATTERSTVNFDVEFQTKNTPAMYVSPTVDAPIIRLQGFGTKEMSFAYVKEGLASPDYEEINSRQLGDQFGQVDVMRNWVENIRRKLAITEFNFENLFELNASNLIFTGRHTAESARHPTVLYDFNRTVVTTAEDFAKGYVPEVDLTTLDSGGVGNLAWTSNGTPYKDLITACATTLRRGSIRSIVMAGDAYELLEADITANYKDAAELTLSVMNRIELKVLPEVDMYQDLNYRRSLPIGNGRTVDIFTYDAIYHNRATGVEAKYVPDGHFAVLTDPSNGIKRYGRILHPNADYAAMPRYINTWEDQKSGKSESEIHCNYLLGFVDIDSVVSWKVM